MMTSSKTFPPKTKRGGLLYGFGYRAQQHVEGWLTASLNGRITRIYGAEFEPQTVNPENKAF